MGAVMSSWWPWRKKRSTAEELESIHSRIESMEAFKRDTQACHRKIIGHLFAYFSVLYLVAALFAYFKYFYHPAWQGAVSQMKLLAPFLVAPFLFLMLKSLLTWWYHRKIKSNEVKLAELNKTKVKILNEVMEKETYKVAKEILEKYAPEQLRANASKSLVAPSSKAPATTAPSTSRPSSATPSSTPGPNPTAGTAELRRRLNATAPLSEPRPAGPRPALLTPAPTGARGTPASSSGRLDGRTSFASESRLAESSAHRELQQSHGGVAPGPPLPRPLIARERGYMDRLVDYLVGDGPNNRYALICKQCQTHNGMALKEEFEFVAYRCAYCHYWNPARKQRPVAPKLVASTAHAHQSDSSSEDEDRVVAPPVDKPLEHAPKAKEDASAASTGDVSEETEAAAENANKSEEDAPKQETVET